MVDDVWDIIILCSDGVGEFVINLVDDVLVLRIDVDMYLGVDEVVVVYYGFSSEIVSEYVIIENNWYYYDSMIYLFYF